MNYLIEERRHALAAEYVLGTLRGAARLRYQKLLMVYPQLRDTTYQWEQHVSALGEDLAPVPPAPEVWNRIIERLDDSSRQNLPGNVVRLHKEKPNLWKGLSAFATAAALVLAVLLIQPTEPTVAEQVTVVQNSENKPLWIVEVFTQTLDATATANVAIRPANDYQLWMVPENGQDPISLGLLPQQGAVSLDKISQFDQLEIAALAVSLEPLGGSPTGQPTEVLFISELTLL